MVQLILAIIFFLGPAFIVLYSALTTYFSNKMYIAPLVTAAILFLLFAIDIVNVGIVPGIVYTMVSVITSFFTSQYKMRKAV